MRRLVARAVKRTFASPLGWRTMGPLLRRPGVIVLTYHRILGEDRTLSGLPVEHFAAQMRWVKDNCDPIGPDELRERAEKPGRVRPAALVTFDDGYRDYHDLAYPVLKQLGIPAIVFVTTSFLDEQGMLWTDHLQWACLSTRKDRVTLPWSGQEVALPHEAARAVLGEQAREHLKGVPDDERRQLVAELVRQLGDPPARPREMLNWDEVRATVDLTCYGGHSHTHPILSQLSREQAVTEIRTCRDRIAAETSRAPRYFAYPNGRPEDYNAETQSILRDHGFTIAFSSTEGIAGADTDWMAVKRLPTTANDIPAFVWLADGLSRG